MVFFWVFSEPLQLAEVAGLEHGNWLLYTMFSAITAVAILASDPYVFNAMELTHGYKMYDYLVYTKYRFLQRETWWKGCEDR